MPEPAKQEVTTENNAIKLITTSPLIFISHDSRDADLAEAFSKLLSGVSAGVLKSFRSSDRKGSQGIEYGAEWYPELMSKLESASDVVCLLTQRSLDRPWILYEAGVAKGKLSTPVYGIVVGIPLNQANAGPFAQFQNCDDNEDSLTKLVMQLVRRVPGSEPDLDAIQMQVHTFKERANEALAKLAAPKEHKDEEPVTETSVPKLFEEIKVMFQDILLRSERGSNSEELPRTKRLTRHPSMIFDIALKISRDSGDLFGIVIIASILRNDAPWLYDLTLEVYNSAKKNNLKNSEEAIEKLSRVIDFISDGPFSEGIMSRETYRICQELPSFLSYLIHETYPRPKMAAIAKKMPKSRRTEIKE